MLIAAIVIFVIAAVFGLLNLIPILQNRPTTKSLVFTHGGAAVIALLLVIVAVAQAAGASPVTALVFFVIAALGGLVLFSLDMQKKPVPKWLAVVHPIIAAIGLILLIVFVASAR